jgi:hypothetical protein
MMSLRVLALAAALAGATLGLAACEKKTGPAAPEAHACRENSDCAGGWLCLNGKCASMKSSTIYADPENVATPQKVKKEVERLQDKAMGRVDKTMGQPE